MDCSSRVYHWIVDGNPREIEIGWSKIFGCVRMSEAALEMRVHCDLRMMSY